MKSAKFPFIRRAMELLSRRELAEPKKKSDDVASLPPGDQAAKKKIMTKLRKKIDELIKQKRR
jgi:hypothetical protein